MIVAVTVPGLAVFGKPEADRLTLPLKPFSRFTVIVLVTLCPRVTFKLLGEADRLKSGADAEALTVKLNGSGMRQAS